MTVQALDRNQRADIINRELYTLRQRLTNSANYIAGTDRYSTNDLDIAGQGYERLGALLSGFSAAHGVWFATAYPDEAAALPDAINACTNVRDAMQTLLSSGTYMRAGEGLRKAITTADRAGLDASIRAEL